MTIEIPLSDRQKLILCHIIGYEPLEYLLTSDDLREHARREYTHYPHDIFLSKQEKKGISDFEELQGRLIVKARELFESYPLLNMRGIDARERFEKEVSEEDKKSFKSFQRESNRVYDKEGAIINLGTRRIKKAQSSLHGIVGIVQGSGNLHKYFYMSHVIPLENYQAVRESMQSGVFQKDIIDEDRRLLNFLLKRTKNIKGDKIHGHNPRFSIPQIARERGGEEKELRRSLYRLTGVLCHAYGPQHSVYQIKGKRRAVYWDSWFIPHIRFPLAESLVQ